MTNYLKHLITTLILLITSLGITAQSFDREVIASSGTSGSNSSITLDWTLGESIISTASNPNTTLVQGFHQPPTQTIIKLHSISGQVFINDETTNNATVILCRIESPEVHSEIQSSALFNGTFNFFSIPNGQYYIKAIPDNTDNLSLITYYPRSFTQEEAYIFNLNSSIGGLDLHLNQKKIITPPEPEKPIKYNILTFPNPVEENLTVKRISEDNSQELKIELFNLYGHLLHTSKIKDAESITFSISHLANGFYILRLSEEYHRESKLIMKK